MCIDIFVIKFRPIPLDSPNKPVSQRFQLPHLLSLFFLLSLIPSGHKLSGESLASLAAHSHLDRSVLANTRDDPNAAILIDQKMLMELSKKGRIAGTGVSSAPLPEEKESPPSEAGRNKWRNKHRTLVRKIRKHRGKIEKIKKKIRLLDDKYSTAGSWKTIAHLEEQIRIQKEALGILQLEDATMMTEFSGMIRDARKEGAQPGWFRDLPQP